MEAATATRRDRLMARLVRRTTLGHSVRVGDQLAPGEADRVVLAVEHDRSVVRITTAEDVLTIHRLGRISVWRP